MDRHVKAVELGLTIEIGGRLDTLMLECLDDVERRVEDDIGLNGLTSVAESVVRGNRTRGGAEEGATHAADAECNSEEENDDIHDERRTITPSIRFNVSFSVPLPQ